jgi:hypothetical protein
MECRLGQIHYWIRHLPVVKPIALTVRTELWWEEVWAKEALDDLEGDESDEKERDALLQREIEAEWIRDTTFPKHFADDQLLGRIWSPSE